MTMIDYLLLGGFTAAGIYTICRLFVGLRNSSTAEVRTGAPEEVNPDGDGPSSRRGPVD